MGVNEVALAPTVTQPALQLLPSRIVRDKETHPFLPLRAFVGRDSYFEEDA